MLSVNYFATSYLIGVYDNVYLIKSCYNNIYAVGLYYGFKWSICLRNILVDFDKYENYFYSK